VRRIGGTGEVVVVAAGGDVGIERRLPGLPLTGKAARIHHFISVNRGEILPLSSRVSLRSRVSAVDF